MDLNIPETNYQMPMTVINQIRYDWEDDSLGTALSCDKVKSFGCF